MVVHIVTASSFRHWIYEKPGAPSILMIHLHGCRPCAKAGPEFQILAAQWPQANFGSFLIRSGDQDAIALAKSWGVTKTPTFLIYDLTPEQKRDLVKMTIGITGLEELQEYLSSSDSSADSSADSSDATIPIDWD